jgi:hypothetical protein
MPEIISYEAFIAEFNYLPKPQYPFPDFIHADFQRQREEYYAWIDREYTFHSKEAREKHKQHQLVDIASRGCPFLSTLAELRPLANYAANGAMMDDYWDRCSYDEMYAIVKQVTALLTGEDAAEPTDNGIFHQFWILRQDAIQCGMPERLYKQYVAEIHDTFMGYADEKRYNASNTPPPLPVYLIIRDRTSGGLPFAKYVCMQKDYRRLPDDILEHPQILRLHTLCSRMIGFHNDIISLPKELSRKGDVVNIVKVLQHEHNLPIKEAYMMAMQLHDDLVKEFMVLYEHLPSFGQWHDTVRRYVWDLGVMVAGVYAWHTNDRSRYIPGGYVEGEYVSRQG